MRARRQRPDRTRRRFRGARLGRVPAREVVAVTCLEDGRDHLVTDEAMALGIAAHGGRYAGLCGHSVLAAGLATPPGPPCPQCAAAGCD